MLRASFRKIVIILGVVVIIIAGCLVVINEKKNDLSKDLLLRINADFKGDFSVGKISLGSVFSYPNMDVIVDDLYFHAAKNNRTNGETVLHIPFLEFRANLSDLFFKNFLFEDLKIKNAKLYIEKDSLDSFIISDAFSFSRNNERNDEPNDFIFSINKITIETIEIIIKDQSSKLDMLLSVKQINGNLLFEKNYIKGELDVQIDPQVVKLNNATINSEFPIAILVDYNIDIDKENISVITKEFLIGEEGYELKYDYNFSENPFMNLNLVSGKNGVNFNSVFIHDKDDSKGEQDVGLQGLGYLKTDVSWNPSLNKPFLEAINASFSIEGKDLLVYGMDLDTLINQFKKSQKFNFIDIGAVLFVGPVGLAVTKGGDFARLAFLKTGDATEVRHLVANWSMKSGVLETKDVALSTNSNLICTNGWYNTINDSLDFKFSVVDYKGCELLGQRVFGTSEAAEFSEVKYLKTFFGPVTTFFRNLGLSKCNNVYHGKINHPRNKD